MNINDFLSWELLATYAGASAAVMALTQVCKRYASKADPKWFALAWAFVVSMGVYFVTAIDITAAGVVMAVLNAIIIAGASIGTFEGIFKPILSAVIGKQGEHAEVKEVDDEPT